MTLLSRRKHQTTAATTPRAKGADAPARRVPRWGAAATLAIATLSLATGPLANGPLAADIIQGAARTGKLSWRAPTLPNDSQTSANPSTTADSGAARDDSDRAKPRDTSHVFDNDPADDAKQPASSTEKSTAASTVSTLRVRGNGSSTTSGVGLAQSSSRESSADPSASQSRRTDRAARPYSRKATASSKATATSKAAASKSVASSKSSVQRLSEADPSPYSSGSVETDNSSITIVQVSAVKDVGPALVAEAEPPVDDHKRELIEQAGLQEGAEAPASPFDSEPTRTEPEPEQFDKSAKDQLAQNGLLPGRCPTPRDLKPLDQISINIAAEPGPFPAECGLGDETFTPRDFACTTYAWKATALCHKPLYFEDWDLERYGHSASPLFQPLISAAQFYLVLPILPYKMGLEPPGECIYALGYYRPGSCAPRIIPNVPISVRAALLEAGVWVAGVALVP